MITTKLKINYLPELSALLFGRVKPSMVSINLTDKCNQRCVYCELGKNPSFQNKDILTKDDLFWIIDQMAINKITRLSMCGGEPFLFNSIIDAVAYAREKNIRCNITTNGMTITRLNEREIKMLKDCEAEINISLDSFQDHIQIKTRGSDLALKNAVESIQLLNNKGIPVTVLTVISKYNYYDLYNSLIKAYEYGIFQVLYQPVIFYSNYPDKPVIENKRRINVRAENLDILMDQLHNIFSFEKKHKIKTNVYRILPWIKYYIKNASDLNRKWFFQDVLKKFYCREVHAVIDISYDGGIQPCGLLPAEKNIRENKETGLLSQWYEATSKLRDDLRNNILPIYCNGCCHKFSRNMLASVMKYPLSNRVALMKILWLITSRTLSGIYK